MAPAGQNMEPAVHFVGFKGEEYWSAVKIWGRPAFIHPGWDRRAHREIVEGDVVVHARGEWTAPAAERSYSDTAECANLERLSEAVMLARSSG